MDRHAKSGVSANMTITFPVQLVNAPDGEVWAMLPDFPEAEAQGRDRVDALHHVSRALQAAVTHRLQSGFPVPTPSECPGFARVPLTL